MGSLCIEVKSHSYQREQYLWDVSGRYFLPNHLFYMVNYACTCTCVYVYTGITGLLWLTLRKKYAIHCNNTQNWVHVLLHLPRITSGGDALGSRFDYDQREQYPQEVLEHFLPGH